jgi:hypothetical protein
MAYECVRWYSANGPPSRCYNNKTVRVLWRSGASAAGHEENCRQGSGRRFDQKCFVMVGVVTALSRQAQGADSD